MFNVARAVNPDLLLATPVTINSKNGTVNFAFKHAMHRLIVSLSGDALSAAEWGKATVTLAGMKSCAYVDDATHTVDAGKASIDNNNSENNVYPTGTGATTAFFVAPQDLSVGEPWI